MEYLYLFVKESASAFLFACYHSALLLQFNYVFFFSPSFIFRSCGIKCIVVLLYFSLQIFNTCPSQASHLIHFKF